ncbi:MAG: DNA adenine methylase [Flavobacteriales bacterium]
MSVQQSRSHITARPFLKWAGGKRQLLEQFRSMYPDNLAKNKVKHFHEPFLGSGAVFFDLVNHFKIETAHLYDINEELVLVYRVVQQDVYSLLEFLERYERDYLKLGKEKRLEYFYEQRTNFNLQRFNMDYNKYSEHWIPRAAQFIFLNRTCFNGLYRVNQKGDFNTPAGDYSKPTICDADNLQAVHQALGIAEIRIADFTDIVNEVQSHSFVYCDPPYRPISRTASFKAYSRHDFHDAHQIVLASVFRQLDKQGAQVMLSNSDPKNHDPHDHFFDDLYAGYRIERVSARRSINANATLRGAVKEIVVMNY